MKHIARIALRYVDYSDNSYDFRKIILFRIQRRGTCLSIFVTNVKTKIPNSVYYILYIIITFRSPIQQPLPADWLLTQLIIAWKWNICVKKLEKNR